MTGRADSGAGQPQWLKLALPLVKASEGCQLLSYPDPATGGEPFTIGWGQTGPDIGPSTAWTQAEADAALIDTLKANCRRIKASVAVPLEPQQLAALSSFVYNVGIGAFRSSTLLELLNYGEYEDAADQFPRWKYADGNIMQGLVTRRRRERSLFLTGAWK